MLRLKSRFCIVALSLAVLFVSINRFASAQEATGAITGTGDPGAQIIVTRVGDGEVIGVVVKCDGSYRVEGLKSGDYEIFEKGPHHAVRKLSVSAGHDSHVNLAPVQTAKDTCLHN
jgi:hypothetical protein